MAKVEKETTDEKKKYEPAVSERVLFAEKYRKAGYNVTVTDGVLMFCGPYEMTDITALLKADGYVGSFGVSEKVQKRVADYAEE